MSVARRLAIFAAKTPKPRPDFLKKIDRMPPRSAKLPFAMHPRKDEGDYGVDISLISDPSTKAQIRSGREPNSYALGVFGPKADKLKAMIVAWIKANVKSDNPTMREIWTTVKKYNKHL